MKGRFKKHQHPLILKDENFFQKSASMVEHGIAIELQPWSPIFEKSWFWLYTMYGEFILVGRKASAPPLFLMLFQNELRVREAPLVLPLVQHTRVHPNSCAIFGYPTSISRVCMVGCMGRISNTNLKTRMVISKNATSKNQIELLVPGQI